MRTHKKPANGHSPGKNASRKVTVRPSLSATAPDHCHRAANHLNTGTERPCHGTTAINIPEKDRRIKTPPQRESSAALHPDFSVLAQQHETIVDQIKHAIDEKFSDLIERWLGFEQRVNILLFSRTQTNASSPPEPTVWVRTIAGTDTLPASELRQVIADARKKNYDLLINAIDRTALIFNTDVKLPPLHFDMLLALAQILPTASSSADVFKKAWREMNRGELRSSVAVHSAVKRTVNRLNDRIAQALRKKLVHWNGRWRFSPPLARFCLIEWAQNETESSETAETNKRRHSS